MAKITISDLRPAGSGFFEDTESYMDDLSNDDLNVYGGKSSTPIIGPAAWKVGKWVAQGAAMEAGRRLWGRVFG
ncbi:hypothetical protein [Coleofasciculus sp.]|uniref:hypothetical protein n=1 Tax=Coleofasciculus sp. TaxID=3100458 RepID=UPI003A20B842